MRRQKKSPGARAAAATARGAATRARIVKAAADLVYRRGASATSLEDIMEASATSKSQLYHYFADKDALMRAVIELQTGRVMGVQAAHLDAVNSLAGLRRWRDAVVIDEPGHPRRRRLSARIAGERALRSVGERAGAAGARLRPVGIAAQARLRRDARRGELKPEANPAELATAVIAALQGGLLLAQTTRSSRPLELALDMAIGHVARLSG